LKVQRKQARSEGLLGTCPRRIKIGSHFKAKKMNELTKDGRVKTEDKLQVGMQHTHKKTKSRV
jgi:hypothetical protein